MEPLFSPEPRLAIVVSHPIQYYAPWFAYLQTHLRACIHVFYLWDFGLVPRMDRGFGRELAWDLDLLAGYAHSFLVNEAHEAGTHHFSGLDNPGLTHALAAWKPDAILLFGYRYRSHLRILTSARLRGIPFLLRGDSHLLGRTASGVSAASKRVMRRIIFKRFTAFLSVGQANAAYLRDHGVEPTRIFFAPHAVDNHRFVTETPRARKEAKAWRRQLNIPDHHRVILFAGKFESKKRPDALIQAFFRANLPDATLLLVGSGAMGPQLRAAAAGNGNIRFAPFQNQRLMPRTYAAADLVVLPSEGPEESWGLVINEAMACGKPVLVSNHVGCQADLVEDGRNGLVVPAGDVAALSAALQKACGDPARLKRWGEAAHERISRFSYVETTAGLEDALTFTLMVRRT